MSEYTRKRIMSTFAKDEHDFYGAFCEVITCLMAGMYGRPAFGSGNPGQPNEPGPGLDEDSGGYYANARRQMEDHG